jgi:hypothetical protein
MPHHGLQDLPAFFSLFHFYYQDSPMIFELKVFDDGECAVRKTIKPQLMQSNTILKSNHDLVQYLTNILCLRWPLSDVLKLINSAEMNQWVEFK